MIKKLRTKIVKLDEHTLEVLKKSFSSIIVKVLAVVFGLIVSVTLGKTIGAEGLGIISLANQIVAIVVVVGMLGMNNAVLKEVSIGFESKNWQHIANVMHTAIRINLPLVLGISLLLLLLTPF